MSLLRLLPLLPVLVVVLAAATGRLRALGALLRHCHAVLLNGKSHARWLAGLLSGILPPVVWTLSFKMARRLPDEWRPTIHTKLLPQLEAALLSFRGILLFTVALVPLALLLRARSATRSPLAYLVLLFPAWLKVLNFVALNTTWDSFQDVLAWIFYGCLHFASPFLMGWWAWAFCPPGAAIAFGWCLGLQNFTGLCIHILFPNAAPWYADTWAPTVIPDYSFPGSAAGLVRVDKVLGTHLYEHAFAKSPVVFGALPSLHAATATCLSFFVARYGGTWGLVFALVYCSGMFWSTQYEHHHYAVDLVAGTALSAAYFTLMAQVVLRRIDAKHEREQSTRGIDRLFCRPSPWARAYAQLPPHARAVDEETPVPHLLFDKESTDWSVELVKQRPALRAVLSPIDEKDDYAPSSGPSSRSCSTSGASSSSGRTDRSGSLTSSSEA